MNVQHFNNFISSFERESVFWLSYSNFIVVILKRLVFLRVVFSGDEGQSKVSLSKKTADII